MRRFSPSLPDPEESEWSKSFFQFFVQKVWQLPHTEPRCLWDDVHVESGIIRLCTQGFAANLLERSVADADHGWTLCKLHRRTGKLYGAEQLSFHGRPLGFGEAVTINGNRCLALETMGKL